MLALRSLVMQARSHDLVGAEGAPVSDVAAINWVRRMLLPEQWPLIVAITQSNPEPNEPATWPRTGPTAPDTERAPDTIRTSQRTDSHAAVDAATQPPSLAANARPPDTNGAAVQQPPSHVLRALEHLRVASLDRLTREAAANGAPVTRHKSWRRCTVGHKVRWFGRSIVALRAEETSEPALCAN